MIFHPEKYMLIELCVLGALITEAFVGPQMWHAGGCICPWQLALLSAWVRVGIVTASGKGGVEGQVNPRRGRRKLEFESWGLEIDWQRMDPHPSPHQGHLSEPPESPTRTLTQRCCPTLGS